MRRPMTFTRKPVIAKIEKIMAILADGKPRRIAEIAQEASLSVPGFRPYLNKLRDEKKIRVCGYVDNTYPLFTLGNRPDLKRKPRQTNADRHRQYYDKKAADPEFLIEQKNRSAKSRLRLCPPVNVDIYAIIFRRVA